MALMQEAEDQFKRRDKTLNFFSIMVNKKMTKDEESADEEEKEAKKTKAKGKKGKKKKVRMAKHFNQVARYSSLADYFWGCFSLWFFVSSWKREFYEYIRKGKVH